MPEENNGHAPSGDPERQALSKNPTVDLPQESKMPEGGTGKPQADEDTTEELKREIHWVTHATFWSQVVLALIGLAALWIYYGQLGEMIKATKAARYSAYDACVSAQIARQTLLEVRSGESDTHNTAAGTVAEAAITTRGDSPLFSFAITYNQTSQTSPPTSIGINLQNVGRTAARNVDIRYAAMVVPQDEEVTPNSRAPFDMADFGVVPPSFFQGGSVAVGLRMLDGENKPIGPITADLWQSLQSGKQYVTAFGRADYTDTFGLDHYQTFCVTFDLRQADMSVLPEKKLRHSACRGYNRIDKNLIYSIPAEAHETPPTEQIGDVLCVVPSEK